ANRRFLSHRHRSPIEADDRNSPDTNCATVQALLAPISRPDKATFSCIMLRSRSVRLVEFSEPLPRRPRSGCKDRVERSLNLLRVDVVIRTSVGESLHRDVEVGLGSLGLYRRHACAVDPLPCPPFPEEADRPRLVSICPPH